MPNFYVDDVDISVDEFISACSKSDIKELVTYLKKGKLLKDTELSHSINEQEHITACSKIMNAYHRLSNEDCKIIKLISEKI